MKNLPETVRAAWADRDGYAVFATVDPAGNPNAIYVGSVREYGDDTVVIADNYFHKTRTNILTGSRATLLFLTKGKKSFQLKGRIECLTSGPIFDDMKQWNSTRHPGVAAAALRIDEVYSGAERII